MKKDWLSIRNQSGDGPVEILIYEQIGENWWDGSGVAAKQFAEEFKTIPQGRKIHLRINSPGGAIADGLAIYNTIAKRRSDVTSFVDGYALSAASFLMLAAGKVVAPKNAVIMVHKPQGMVDGDADSMRQMASILDTHQEAIASIYAERTHKEMGEVNRALNAETWFTGEEAQAWGLVDEVTAETNINNNFALSLDTLFKNLPAGLRHQKQSPATSQPRMDSPAANLSGGTAADNYTTNKNQGHTMPENTPPAAVTNPPAPAPQPVVVDLTPLMTRIEQLENRLTQTANSLPGAAPLTVTPKVESVENVARAAIASKAQGKDRFTFIRDNWNELKNQVPVLPIRNTNTTDSALTTSMLASGLIVVLQSRLAPLNAFTRDFGIDGYKPKATVQVPIAIAGGTAQENATSFEDTTNFVGNIDNVAVTVNRITSGAHLTPAELNSGFRMAQFVEIKACELADKIQAAVNAIITTTNFDRTTQLGASALVSAAASFGQAELSDVWASIAKSRIKNVMLDGTYYCKFLPSSMESFNPLANNAYPGWDGFYLNTYWTGAETNTKGFACNPQAIVVCSGLPLASPNRGMTTTVQTITLPGIGLTVEQQEWYATDTKADWANWEVMFGAAKGDPAAGCLIKSA